VAYWTLGGFHNNYERTEKAKTLPVKAPPLPDNDQGKPSDVVAVSEVEAKLKIGRKVLVVVAGFVAAGVIALLARYRRK